MKVFKLKNNICRQLLTVVCRVQRLLYTIIKLTASTQLGISHVFYILAWPQLGIGSCKVRVLGTVIFLTYEMGESNMKTSCLYLFVRLSSSQWYLYSLLSRRGLGFCNPRI